MVLGVHMIDKGLHTRMLSAIQMMLNGLPMTFFQENKSWSLKRCGFCRLKLALVLFGVDAVEN